MNKRDVQFNLMRYWGINSPIAYFEKMIEIFKQHQNYLSQFKTIAEMELAVYNMIVRRLIFDFDTEKYVKIGE